MIEGFYLRSSRINAAGDDSERVVPGRAVAMKIIVMALFLVCSFEYVAAQGSRKIVINEFLASNVSIDADIVDFSDYSDWIEIYNDESLDVDIGGYFLTDNLNSPTLWTIPSGTVIKAKGFLRFWADGYNDIPGHTHKRDYYPFDYFTTKYYHLNFSLNAAGEAIGLFDPNGTLLDSVSFGFQPADVQEAVSPTDLRAGSISASLHRWRRTPPKEC